MSRLKTKLSWAAASAALAGFAATPLAATAVAPAAAATAATATATASAQGAIAWTPAASDADVDAAFAQARALNKPLFVYWGAKWCPPCNQLQATLFNRQDFIERSRAFVPVYVDGDSAGAQKLGARFKVRGYPTMLLFDPQGTELTRLPGEVDAAQYTQVLTLGMSAQRPVKAVLVDALAGGDAARRLRPNDWKLLAFYSWETDEQQVVPKPHLAATLRRLADACPPERAEAGMGSGAERGTDRDARSGAGKVAGKEVSQGADSATRLLLKALAASSPPDPRAAAAVPAGGSAAGNAAAPKFDANARARLLRVLASAPAARAHMDVLTNNATELVRAVSADASPERARLLGAFNTALKRLAADATLSRADRMTAVIAQVDLAKPASRPAPPKGGAADVVSAAAAATAALPPALLADVRDHAARADRDITDGYERLAVIPTAAYLLERAGLMDESDALLKANLTKTSSPYYLMSGLAGNAKKRGDKAEALRWYELAFDKSEGPATRLQWGASYVAALVELAPQDAARIEKAARQVLTEAAAHPNAFYERSARSLRSVGTRLTGWNERGDHAAVIGRLQTQLDSMCQRLDAADPQRSTCEALFRPTGRKAAAAG